MRPLDLKEQSKTLVEDAVNSALESVSLNEAGLVCLTGRKQEFEAYLTKGLTRFSTKRPDYTSAQAILGVDFISPEEVASYCGLAYTDEQVAYLGKTLPDDGVLTWCRENDMMLLPGPPQSMCFLDLVSLFSAHIALFDVGEEWFFAHTEVFARGERVGAGSWIAMGKREVPGSFGKEWLDQQRLVEEPLIIPNTAEVVWAFLSYLSVRDRYLLEPNRYVRGSSISEGGMPICIGRLDNELDIAHYSDGDSEILMGMAFARHF